MKFAELYLVPKNQFLSFLKYEEGVGGKNAIHVNQLNVTDGERLNIKQILKENGGLQNVLTAARGVKGANQMGGRTARAQGPGPSSGSDPSAGGSHHTSVPGSLRASFSATLMAILVIVVILTSRRRKDSSESLNTTPKKREKEESHRENDRTQISPPSRERSMMTPAEVSAVGKYQRMREKEGLV